VADSYALRRATPKDLAALAEHDGRAFGVHYTEDDLGDIEATLPIERFWLALDPADDAVVGSTGSFDFQVTLPGGATLAMPGVTWVGVAVTHRRRGILRALMIEQHREFLDQGVALSGLTASEGAIYGRFGYGITSTHRAVEITRRRAVLRPDLPDTGGVRQVDTEQIRTIGPDIHRRWAAITPGAVDRDDKWWQTVLRDREQQRGGGTALFHLAHPDGYASFRREHGDRALRVTELFAVTPEAHRELWRTLLATDLTETVTSRSLALDDPLPWLLTDPRQVRTTNLNDGLWTRVLDVPVALSARRYATEIDVVLDVRDGFLDRGGRFRLRGGPDGAVCEPTTDAPDVHVDIRVLGPLLFGGARAAALSWAGLLTADDPAVLRRVDAAFGADRLPRHGTEF
jgi:predicted acetyltransferase